MIIVVVTGDRNWTNRSVIQKALSNLPQQTILLHGDCRGLDQIAASEAIKLGIQTLSVPANWQRFGRAAGPIRNREMLDLEPDLVLAFHDHLDISRGTKDCVQQALARGLTVQLYDSMGNMQIL